MRFVQVDEGFVDRRSLSAGRPQASGPRFARVGDELLCSYVVQSKLGVNDFLPMLARSTDNGRSWGKPAAIWPDVAAVYSVFGAISPAPTNGQLFYVGTRYVIDAPGESLWSDATQGLKQNELFWSRSIDVGRTWSPPRPIPMPVPGSAESAAPMCVTSAGRWLVPYSPYNTFDPDVRVDRGQVVLLLSDDRGATWQHRSMLRFAEPLSGGAEAWAAELSDGRLLATAWHTDLSGSGRTYENAYALSSDGGSTWSPTRGTGILGQATALTPLDDGRALFIHNRREPRADAGVWFAVVAPGRDTFSVIHEQKIWAADAKGRTRLEDWTGFTFGEPSALLLGGSEVLLAFWYTDLEGSGIRFLRLEITQ